MISAQTVAMMKRVAATLFTDTCTIEQRIQVTDEYGAERPSWQVVTSGVACRLITEYAFSQSQIGEVGEKHTMTDTMRLIVPTGTGLQTDYRVTVGGFVYLVTGLITELTSEVFEQVIVQRMR